jgi:hypothetical protein
MKKIILSTILLLVFIAEGFCAPFVVYNRLTRNDDGGDGYNYTSKTVVIVWPWSFTFIECLNNGSETCPTSIAPEDNNDLTVEELGIVNDLAILADESIANGVVNGSQTTTYIIPNHSNVTFTLNWFEENGGNRIVIYKHQ